TLSNDDAAKSMRAVRYDNGVGLSWQTASEVDNLGFNIYRDEGGKRIKVNPQLIAGSALKVGAGTTLSAGQSYDWWDNAVAVDGTYGIEDIDLNGRGTLHGPVSITGRAPGKRLSAEEQRRTLLLSQLGLEQNRLATADTSGPLEQRARLADPAPQEIKAQ